MICRAETFRGRKSLHHRQLLPPNNLAGGISRRKFQRRRIHPKNRGVPHIHRPGKLVWPHMGPHRLQVRQQRQRIMRDRQLRHQLQVRRLRQHAGISGGVHLGLTRLLRRQPGGRVQPADDGDADQRERWQLQCRRV